MCSIALPTRSIIIVRNSGEKKTLPDDQDTKGWKGGYRDAWKFIASRRNTATWVSWMKSLLVMQYTKALKTWNEPPHYNVVGKPPTPCAEIRCKTQNNHNVDPHDQLLVVKVWLWWSMLSLWHSNPDRLVGDDSASFLSIWLKNQVLHFDPSFVILMIIISLCSHGSGQILTGWKFVHLGVPLKRNHQLNCTKTYT